jgi:hypothetical protein
MAEVRLVGVVLPKCRPGGKSNGLALEVGVFNRQLSNVMGLHLTALRANALS